MATIAETPARPRLGFWHRLGIVLSIVWIVGASYYHHKAYRGEGREIADLNFESCMEAKIAAQDYTRVCGETYLKEIREFGAYNPTELAIRVITPLIAAWIVAYLVYFAGRWVWRGRAAA